MDNFLIMKEFRDKLQEKLPQIFEFAETIPAGNFRDLFKNMYLELKSALDGNSSLEDVQSSFIKLEAKAKKAKSAALKNLRSEKNQLHGPFRSFWVFEYFLRHEPLNDMTLEKYISLYQQREDLKPEMHEQRQRAKEILGIYETAILQITITINDLNRCIKPGSSTLLGPLDDIKQKIKANVAHSLAAIETHGEEFEEVRDIYTKISLTLRTWEEFSDAITLLEPAACKLMLLNFIELPSMEDDVQEHVESLSMLPKYAAEAEFAHPEQDANEELAQRCAPIRTRMESRPQVVQLMQDTSELASEYSRILADIQNRKNK